MKIPWIYHIRVLSTMDNDWAKLCKEILKDIKDPEKLLDLLEEQSKRERR